MKKFTAIKIIGIDENRPPLIRKEPYIDLFFKLSREAPEDWREDFNQLTSKLNPSVKIKKNMPLFIETYIHDMEHIPAHLEMIKKIILACSKQYIEKARLKELAAKANNSSVKHGAGQQGKLNEIINALKFND